MYVDDVRKSRRWVLGPCDQWYKRVVVYEHSTLVASLPTVAESL
jgi:hypothetical protein